jgi:hypothetical protein
VVAQPAHAAFQRIAYPKLAADLPGVGRLVAISEGGIARDHQHIGDSREIGRQIVGERIGKAGLRKAGMPET